MARTTMKCWSIIYLLLFPYCAFAQCELGKNYAVFFGVADYETNSGWPDLQYPVQDIESVARLLHDYYAFETTVITNPSRAEIWDQLYRLKEKTDWSPQDQLLLFFSGHGAEGYFIPRDGRAGREQNTALAFNQNFQDFLNEIPIHHQLVVIDACYSGSFFTAEFRSGPGNDSWKRGLIEEEEDQNLKILCSHQSRKTRLALTSAESTSRAPDRSALVKAFKELLLDWKDGENILYTGNIFLQLQREATTPLFDEFHHSNDRSSSFVFLPQKVRQRLSQMNPCPINTMDCAPTERACTLCPIDPANQEYPLVAVGNTLWTTINLNFANRGESACHDCETYGRLYTWDQAKAACTALGPGWRLPTEADWVRLTQELGEGYDIPGPGGQHGDPRGSYQKLTNSPWKPTLPGYLDRGKLKRAGEQVFYWTSTPAVDASEAVVFWLSKKIGVMKTSLEKDAAASCRCVRD